MNVRGTDSKGGIDNMEKPVSVVLAGGKGERFWPLSRKGHPKQFLKLLPSGKSLLEATVERLLPLSGWERLLVSTTRELEPQVRELLPKLPKGNLVIEPFPRDTAPAVAWSLLNVRERFGDDAVVGFYPADHYIGDREAFLSVVRRGIQAAKTHRGIVTLGVRPKYPSSAFGYIERGEEVAPGVYRVRRFVEKPSVERAKEYLASGRYYWNAGIFLSEVQVLLEEFERHAPDVIRPLMERGVEAYEELPRISLDYALMERTDRAYVIPAAFEWDDLGDWTALERLLGGRSDNVELARHVGLDTHGAIVYATSKDEVIVTLGVRDVVIVRDGDITLVVHKDRVQEIKRLLEELRKREMVDVL